MAIIEWRTERPFSLGHRFHVQLIPIVSSVPIGTSASDYYAAHAALRQYLDGRRTRSCACSSPAGASMDFEKEFSVGDTVIITDDFPSISAIPVRAGYTGIVVHRDPGYAWATCVLFPFDNTELLVSDRWLRKV